MNKVMLIGHIGKDPDVRYYDADQAVAQVRLATTERGYTLPNGTKVPDRTDWHNLVFYRGLAKVVEQYVRKGDRIYVEGRLKYRTYDDSKGQRQYATEIVVDSMEMLSSKPDTHQQSAPNATVPNNNQQSSSAAAVLNNQQVTPPSQQPNQQAVSQNVSTPSSKIEPF